MAFGPSNFRSHQGGGGGGAGFPHVCRPLGRNLDVHRASPDGVTALMVATGAPRGRVGVLLDVVSAGEAAILCASNSRLAD